jgi:hypothetical protein
MLASMNSYGAGGTSYGVFNNSEDMALNLGFSGFRRGSYDFYKSDFRYLNDKATRGGINDAATSAAIRGVIIPAGVSSVYDQTLGKNLKRPFLHVRYRASQTDDRRMKTWVTGSVGATTSALEASASTLYFINFIIYYIMAKKTKKTEVETTPQVVEQPKVETQVVEKPKPKRVEKKNPILKDGWELKDRIYRLKGDKKPISRSIRSANIHWFDQEKGYERELKYCQNQKTVFVDEMKGDQRLEHIVFRNGMLIVEKEKTVLQKLLSLYHPDRDKIFYEEKPVAVATSEIAWLEMEIEALNAAKNIDIDMAEAIMRVEVGSKVSEMSSKELKRDLLLYAKRNPELFLELVNDDNVQLRNFGIKATELGIIKLSSDQRTFLWASNDRKLMNVPFDEHPYSALAAWFKTDEGMEIYSNIEKRLN